MKGLQAARTCRHDGGQGRRSEAGMAEEGRSGAMPGEAMGKYSAPGMPSIQAFATGQAPRELTGKCVKWSYPPSSFLDQVYGRIGVRTRMG